jgi:para-nitrobenzyl esterase
VRGFTDGDLQVFRGVRYGANTATMRFMPPAAPEAWRGVVDAREFGPASPQPGKEPGQSEDCLFLNVMAPSAPPKHPRPVIVYIHGGAYTTGSGSSPLYDGANLCRRGDVVVVTVNHRLNLFGHLYLPGFPDSGNAGMLDLVLALRWVRDNIGAFGGDPGCVTLMGQSGGGAKIATLMAMPAAAGLFHRAITMSGQQLTASGPLHAAGRTRTLLEKLGLPKERAAELVRLPVQELQTAHAATSDPYIGRGAAYMGPVMDERTLTRHPFYPDAPPQSAGVPMMIGNTRDETRSLIGRGDPSTFILTWRNCRRASRPRCAWTSPGRMSLPSIGASIRSIHRRRCSLPPPPRDDPGEQPSSRQSCAPHRVRRFLPTSSTGAHRRTAASGARFTRWTSR